MKKILAIAIAVMMVMALSVSVYADTLFTHEFTDAHDDGWWEDTSMNGLGSDADLIAALKTEGAKLVIYASADAVPTEDGGGFQYGFQDTATWVNVLAHSNFANGEGNLGYESAEVVDGQTVIVIDAATLMAAADEAGAALATYNWINGASAGDTFKIEVVTGDSVPASAAAAEEPAAEEPAAEAPAEDAPAAEAAPAETAAAPSTGIALMVIPAVVALGAVAVSKKH